MIEKSVKANLSSKTFKEKRKAFSKCIGTHSNESSFDLVWSESDF